MKQKSSESIGGAKKKKGTVIIQGIKNDELGEIKLPMLARKRQSIMNANFNFGNLAPISETLIQKAELT